MNCYNNRFINNSASSGIFAFTFYCWLIFQLPLGPQADSLISGASQEVQVFFREVRSCWDAATYEELLHVITGLEQILIMMLLSVCFKDLRNKCQALSSLPLSNFNSVRKIHSYLGKLSNEEGGSQNYFFLQILVFLGG